MLRRDGALATHEGEHVVMHIVEMALDIDGKIVRIQQSAPEWVDIAIDFTESAPAYWRECLADLLPGPGEMTSNDAADTGDGQGHASRQAP
jgi:hypothetical protein